MPALQRRFLGGVTLGIFTILFNVLGGWWNGRHGGLKIPWGRPHESSTLSPPTTDFIKLIRLVGISGAATPKP